jgi:hypothetical protein
LKKENGGKFGKLIWRQIKKQKIAGNIETPIWQEIGKKWEQKV